jgi:hypothetical protein
VSARLMVAGAALHSRGLERDLKAALLQSDGDWDRAFWRLSAEAIENLAWWVQLLGQPTACKMFLTPHEVAVDTDASPWGFGGFLGALSTGGFWGLQERSFSQNGREMRAVELTLQTFVKWLRGRSVLVLTDSAVVCCYLNKQTARPARMRWPLAQFVAEPSDAHNARAARSPRDPGGGTGQRDASSRAPFLQRNVRSSMAAGHLPGLVDIGHEQADWYVWPLSAVGCRLSAVGCRLSAVGCRLSAVR